MSSLEKDQMKICVIDRGSVWKTKVNSNTKVSKLMTLASSHFHGPASLSSSKPPRCRLVLVRTREVLREDKTIGEEDVRNNDEVLFFHCQSAPKRPTPDLRGPTESEIYEATKTIEPRNTDRPRHESHSRDDDDKNFSERFYSDIPKIIVSLIDAAAHLLAFAPDGMEVFSAVETEIKSKREPNLHGALVKQLTEMGFPEKMVLKALSSKRVNLNEAMEWLLEHDSSMEDHKPVEEPTSSQSKSPSVIDAFQDLIQTALRKRYENVKMSSQHIEHLKGMGYDASNAENALRQTDNNLKSAISFLRESSDGTAFKRNQKLDPSGTMFKALMSSEVIQLNLRKPKFLIALLRILEDPQCLSLWLKDKDVCCPLNNIWLLHSTESSGGRCIL